MLEPKQQSRINEILAFWSEVADGSRITERTKSLIDVKELMAIIVSCVSYSDKLSMELKIAQDELLASQEAYQGLVDQEDLDENAHPEYPTVKCVG
jgi:hypothetical protein